MSGTADEEEIDRLRSEVEDLRAQVEADDTRRRGRLRRALAATLVVVAIITVPAATAAVWARRTLVNEQAFADVVAPLPSDPAVEAALTDYLSSQITAAIDAEALFDRALPDRGQILAAPLASAVDGFVHEKVAEVVRSERFAEIWAEVTVRAHRAVLAVVRGENESVQVQDGEVILNLVPALNAVLASINETSPQVLGRDITLPEVTSAELPTAARERIEQALGRPLPEDFGNIVVFRSDELTAVQDITQKLQRGLLLLVGVALVSVVGALVASRSRRRTLLQLALGIAFGVVLVRRVGLRVQTHVVGLAKVPVNAAALDVFLDRLLAGLLSITTGMLIGCAVVAAVAVLTGPYPWAVAVRTGIADLGRSLFGIVSEPRGGAFDTWVEKNLPVLKAGAVVLAIVVLLLFDLSWWGIALLVAVTVAFETRLNRLTPVDPNSGTLDEG